MILVTFTPPYVSNHVEILYKTDNENEACNVLLTNAPCVNELIEAGILKEQCSSIRINENGLDVYGCNISRLYKNNLCLVLFNPSYNSCSEDTGTCKYKLVHFTPIIKTTSVCCVP